MALLVLRSLARKNIETTVAAEHNGALCFASKYCRNRLHYPSPKESRSRFVKAMQKIIRKRRFDALFPISDWTIIPISENMREISPHVKTPLPEHETMQRTYDKSLTFKTAIEAGVPVPRTYFVKNLAELKGISKNASYPLVVKPRWSWVWNGEKATFRRPSYVNSAAELVRVYSTIHKQFAFPLVQEYIPGNNYSVAVLYSNSQPKAMCGIKVYRTFPVTGGNSVYRESAKLDPQLKEYALRLLKALDWHGIAEVEFKLDSRDSVPKLMEVNGRFWGSLEVAMAAGVDFPYLLYRLVVGDDVPQVSNYRLGVKCRWVEGDIQHLVSVMKTSLNGEGVHCATRTRTLLDFFKLYESNLKYDCFYWDDPLPFFSVFYGLVKKK
ncbi:MAG: ATP-grasp domain-containing protein, partial [Promethearchaeota archaeon]